MSEQPGLPKREDNPHERLSPDDKIEALAGEALSALSMPEYMGLWREQLNPQYLSHATRQGFRDHLGIPQHLLGYEEFHTGLVDILEDDKRLRAPLSIRHFPAGDEVAFADWLKGGPFTLDSRFSEATSAHYKFDQFITRYVDVTAVHFAGHEVATDIYGGETGNESFVIYPTDFIASQYPFSFFSPVADTDLVSTNGVGTAYNDIFVWPPVSEQSIPVDAGIVFIPGDTPVDPDTGSRYASTAKVIDGEEKLIVVKDPDLIDRCVTWAKTQDTAALSAAWSTKERLPEQAALLARASEELCAWLAPDTAERLIENIAQLDPDEQVLREEADNLRADWVQAEHTIPAHEYWENHFTRHPEQRPNHLVYYSGDPTRAVSDLLRAHGIVPSDSSVDGNFLGFERNYVHEDRIFVDARAYSDEASRLRLLGHQLLDEQYGTTFSQEIKEPNTQEAPDTPSTLPPNFVLRALRSIFRR